MELYDERPISVQLPDPIEAKIVEADAVVKGQTASSSYKPAILDNGVSVMVPPHIAAGTRIVVDVYERICPAGGLMVSHSGLITVMQRAARKAAPRLRRDFGEVEQLQVVARARPTSSRWPTSAPSDHSGRIRNARPDWGIILEEDGEIEGDPNKPRSMSTRWMARPTSFTGCRISRFRSRSRRSARWQDRNQPGPGLSAADRRKLLGRKGAGRVAQGPPVPGFRAARPLRGLVGTGIPHAAAGMPEAWAKIYNSVGSQVSGIRRFGSAALDFAWVAAGRMDGFWEDDLDLWDTAAGVPPRPGSGRVRDRFSRVRPVVRAARIYRRLGRHPQQAAKAGRGGAAIAAETVAPRKWLP